MIAELDGNDSPDRSRTALWKRRWVRVVLVSAAMFLIFIGPWPAYDGDYRRSEYARETFARLEALDLETTGGALMAAAAWADVTPPLGEPLAGYGARRPKANDGAMDDLKARAVSISNGDKCVTIVGADILLVLPALRRAVLARVDAARDEIYFTATHTHSGPGGYAPRWLDQFTMGAYDRVILDRLAGALADVITRSRAALQPARIDLTVANCPAVAVTSRVDKTSPADRTISCIALRTLDGEYIGGLVTLAAHATCLGRRNRKASGDYPGVVQRGLEKTFGGTWLFAAGAVGSMKPLATTSRGPRRVEEIGANVLGQAAALIRGKGGQGVSTFLSDRGSGRVTLATAVLEVDLPPTQFRISRSWRLSALLTSLLHDRKTYIQALRINTMVLLAQPADYSGELNRRLLQGSSGRLEPVITSFNGDYIGYLIPRDRYRLRYYESRSMNFFGPSCGEYFQELSVRLLRRVATAAPRPNSPAGKELQGSSPLQPL